MAREGGAGWRNRVQWAGLLGGPTLALVCYFSLPHEYVNAAGATVAFSSAGRATLAVMAWMAVWWLTEAVEIPVTALIPIAVFPLLGVLDIEAATAPYAKPFIFLFLGGFLLALAMQRWGLDRRIALFTLRLVGTRPANMIGGFMLASAALSAFVSNTATAAMMLPIGVSVIDLVLERMPAAENATRGKHGHNFSLCLMLGIAYAASIGGIATPIGTPPNNFLLAFMRSSIEPAYQQSVSFARWMVIGVPLVVVLLPIVWLLLTRVIYPIRIPALEGGHDLIEEQYRRLGRMSRGERATLIVFVTTALAWILRKKLSEIGWESSTGAHIQPLSGLSDAGIALIAALALFAIPIRFRKIEFVLDWSTARKLPWGVLILFGGGLSLAEAVSQNGVAEFLGARAAIFRGMPAIFFVILVTTAVVFLTELTSNTATTSTLVPIFAGMAPGLGVHPYLLIVPTAIAASCAFMMPVATPPNAIVFGSGHVSIPEMCKAGFWINLICIVLITALTFTVVGPVLGAR